MISPQLHPDSPPSRPPVPPGEAFNVNLEPTLAAPDETRLAVAAGAEVMNQTPGDAVLNGLWHCLLGSLAAGLAVSAVLGLVVMALSQLG